MCSATDVDAENDDPARLQEIGRNDSNRGSGRSNLIGDRADTAQEKRLDAIGSHSLSHSVVEGDVPTFGTCQLLYICQAESLRLSPCSSTMSI